ncbi:MAG TPA: type II CAAX endopeptidase family protein [Chloroflexota bacterium]|nr:type II CAAX endopeptidase family protein [Chloroflexota bacterium]
MKGAHWPTSAALLIAGGALAALGLLFSPGMLGGRLAGGALFPLSLVVGAIGGVLLLLAMATIVVVPRGRAATAFRGYGSHSTILGLTLLAGVGSLGLVLPALIPTAAAGRSPLALGFMLILSTVVLDAVLIGVVYFRVVRPGVITWGDMGFSPRALPTTWRAGPVAALGLFLGVATIEVLLNKLGVQQTQLQSLQWLREVPLWLFALVALTAAVLAPVAEEIYFRGYVFRAYYEQKGPPQAYLFSAALFALVHLNLPAFLPIFAVGLFLAYVYRRTGSILPGMLAHAFNNTLAFAFLYFAAS